MAVSGPTRAVQKLVLARNTAAGGVTYSPRTGALCPYCGRTAKIYKTLPWEDATRIRYHRCTDQSCPIPSDVSQPIP